MTRKRFTEKALREEIDEINDRLRALEILWRFHHHPRNNYQAADRYEIESNEDDAYKGQGVINIGYGTPREVWGWCWDELYKLENAKARAEA